MMGAIGTGNVVPGVVTASFGTSGTIYAHSARPVVDPRGEIAAFCSSTGAWLPLLCTMNVTQVTERFRGLFGLSHAALDRAVSSVPAGADGLLLLPYLNGERTPNLPAGRGVLHGMTLANTTPAHLARAAMEGVTFGLNYGLNRLAALGVRPREIRLTGGGAKSAAWRQLAADVFGVPVVKMVEDEGAALGGALQAAWCDRLVHGRPAALGRLCAAAGRIDESSRCEPVAAHHRRYRELQAAHDALAARLFRGKP
jgi:xylulokinase